MQFTRSMLLVSAIFAISAAAASVAAPADITPPMTPALLDNDAPKIRPAVHHVKPTDQQRDIDLLRAEVQRLRVLIERCSAAPPGK